MNKIITAIAALSVTLAAAAQQMPREGAYYYLVNGYTGNASDQRLNSCFGTRTINGSDVWGVQPFEAGNERMQWTFVANPDTPEGETPLYAMVNKAGEYVPMLGYINNQNGSVGQDTRFAIETYEGEIPAEAYGFIVTAEGTINESAISKYDTSIHGMKVGDTYITIRPKEYRDNKNDEASVAANTSLYLNAAGSARQLVINLWSKETLPGSSQAWILISAQEAVAPEVPEIACTYDIVDGVVTIPAGQSAHVTLTAESGSTISYAFTEDDSETPEYSVIEEDTAVLLVDKAGTLHFFATRDGLTSETGTVKFVYDLTDGLDGISAEAADKVYYNLQGRRVDAPTKGVYIVKTASGVKKVVLD